MAPSEPFDVMHISLEEAAAYVGCECLSRQGRKVVLLGVTPLEDPPGAREILIYMLDGENRGMVRPLRVTPERNMVFTPTGQTYSYDPNLKTVTLLVATAPPQDYETTIPTEPSPDGPPGGFDAWCVSAHRVVFKALEDQLPGMPEEDPCIRLNMNSVYQILAVETAYRPDKETAKTMLQRMGAKFDRFFVVFPKSYLVSVAPRLNSRPDEALNLSDEAVAGIWTGVEVTLKKADDASKAEKKTKAKPKAAEAPTALDPPTRAIEPEPAPEPEPEPAPALAPVEAIFDEPLPDPDEADLQARFEHAVEKWDGFPTSLPAEKANTDAIILSRVVASGANLEAPRIPAEPFVFVPTRDDAPVLMSKLPTKDEIEALVLARDSGLLTEEQAQKIAAVQYLCPPTGLTE